MAYDAARQCSVLFGGFDANAANSGDTWIWDGSFWTQVAETGPPARSGHALAYDIARERTVLFGGNTGATSFADTWVWDGVTWTQVAETGPPARTAHAMAYDETRGLVVLFGGTDLGELADTWEWDGEAWTQREEGGPIARRGHAMAYDASSGRVVLFGGVSATQGLDDTWEWNGTAWTQVAEFGAPGSFNAAMASDGIGSVLFGGVSSTAAGESGRDSTWEWDGQFWTEHQHFGPPGRVAHAMAFDATRRRFVVFGGAHVSGSPAAAGLLGDTWERPPTEREVAPPGTLRIAAALPNPQGDDLLTEEVHIRNDGPTPVDLSGWKIANSQAGFWQLDSSDGIVASGQVLIVVRAGRPMSLLNTGDTIQLINPANETIDTRSYGQTTSGLLIKFN